MMAWQRARRNGFRGMFYREVRRAVLSTKLRLKLEACRCVLFCNCRLLGGRLREALLSCKLVVKSPLSRLWWEVIANCPSNGRNEVYSNHYSVACSTNRQSEVCKSQDEYSEKFGVSHFTIAVHQGATRRSLHPKRLARLSALRISTSASSVGAVALPVALPAHPIAITTSQNGITHIAALSAHSRHAFASYSRRQCCGRDGTKMFFDLEGGDGGG